MAGVVAVVVVAINMMESTIVINSSVAGVMATFSVAGVPVVIVTEIMTAI